MEIIGIQDHIMFVRGLISKSACAEIIEKFEKDPAKSPGLALKADGKKEVNPDKVSTELSFHSRGGWANLHKVVNDAVSAAILNYIAQYPGLQVREVEWSGYKIKRYDKDQGVHHHVIRAI